MSQAKAARALPFWLFAYSFHSLSLTLSLPRFGSYWRLQLMSEQWASSLIVHARPTQAVCNTRQCKNIASVLVPPQELVLNWTQATRLDHSSLSGRFNLGELPLLWPHPLWSAASCFSRLEPPAPSPWTNKIKRAAS